eukprot:505353-Prymnesium_polylepis.1
MVRLGGARPKALNLEVKMTTSEITFEEVLKENNTYSSIADFFVEFKDIGKIRDQLQLCGGP